MSTTEIGFRLVVSNRYGGFPRLDLIAMGRDEGERSPIWLNSNTMSQAYGDKYPKKVQGLNLDGVRLTSHIYLPYNEESRLEGDSLHYRYIGLSACVRDVFSFDAREAKAYAKTLDKLEKAMDGLSEPGEIFESVAKAIGATFLCFSTGEGVNNARYLSDEDWTFLSIKDGKEKLRRTMQEEEIKARESKLVNS